PGRVVLGAARGGVVAGVSRRLDRPEAGADRPFTARRWFAAVVADITRSNIAVARLILGGRVGPDSGFVAIPLTITDGHALAVLACIITSTPGTVWVSHDSERSEERRVGKGAR